jgi:wobble nucleotide-excising tRNase
MKEVVQKLYDRFANQTWIDTGLEFSYKNSTAYQGIYFCDFELLTSEEVDFSDENKVFSETVDRYVELVYLMSCNFRGNEW